MDDTRTAPGRDGDVIAATSRDHRYEVHAHGAHVTHWAPAGHEDALYVSSASRFGTGEAIRGGVPICLPWFANGRQGTKKPAHGLFRLVPWDIVDVHDTAADDGRLRATLRLSSSDVGHLPGSDQFTGIVEAHYTVTFGPQALELALTLDNGGAAPFTIESALHTYFAVGDIRRTAVTGLEGAAFYDKVAGAADQVQRGPIRFTDETDRVYDSEETVAIEDPVLGRRIVIAKENSSTTVVWNPWSGKAGNLDDLRQDEWTGFVCVESANVWEHAITLGPGESHTMRVTYTIETI